MALIRFVFIIVLCGSCANLETDLQEVHSDELRLDQNGGILYHNDIPFSGYSVDYYPNDTVKAKSISYRDGKKEGLYKKWYKDGTLSYKADYSNGKKNGTSETWWKDGTLRSKSHFLLGVIEGKQEQWYRSGAKFKELNYLHGKEEGMQRAWRENGKIYNNYEAKNGRIFGLKRANLCFQLEDETIVYNSYEEYDEIQD